MKVITRSRNDTLSLAQELRKYLLWLLWIQRTKIFGVLIKTTKAYNLDKLNFYFQT